MSTYFDILVTYLGEGQRYQNKAIKSGGRFIYEVFRFLQIRKAEINSKTNSLVIGYLPSLFVPIKDYTRVC